MTKKNILVVEDEPDISMLIARTLEMKKYKVGKASSGQQALELIHSFKPDLILLDVMLPDIDGFEVCRRIKENQEFSQIPIIFLTVRNNQEDIEHSKAVGATGYFTKPFDPFRLCEEIGKYLAQG